jgi:hypothetical protein
MIPSGQLALWASNTAKDENGNPGSVAALSNQGSLGVYNSGGQTVFNTDYSKSQPSNYLGTYQDCIGGCQNRAMPLLFDGAQQFNYAQCQAFAKIFNQRYFALQNSTSGTNAQCAVSNNFSQASQWGPAGNWTKLSDGTYSGGGASNSVYDRLSASSNYYLVLQDDGNMVINRGTSPSDNQGLIWATGTNGKQKQSNPNYVASKGKYGKNWMPQGSTLAIGEWIGSNSGSIMLIMQSDGNLVLYTFTLASNCQKMKDGNTGGGVGANALYNIGQVGYKSNLGRVAYIDENAELHAYPSSNEKYANSYTEMQGIDSAYHDIPGAAYGNASSPDACKATCNNIPECAGFAYTKSGNVCWPKDSTMYPNGQRTINPNVDLYIRNKSPISRPIGVPDRVNAIDSVTWQSYVNGGDIGNSYGLASATAAQKAQLDQLQSQMNLLSSQISNLTGDFGEGSQQAESQAQTNVIGLTDYVKGLKNTNIKIDGIGENGNIDNILKDSDIVVLQKNYDYLFWSILATGSVLVAMNVAKKKN